MDKRVSLPLNSACSRRNCSSSSSCFKNFSHPHGAFWGSEVRILSALCPSWQGQTTASGPRIAKHDCRAQPAAAGAPTEQVNSRRNLGAALRQSSHRANRRSAGWQPRGNGARLKPAPTRIDVFSVIPARSGRRGAGFCPRRHRSEFAPRRMPTAAASAGEPVSSQRTHSGAEPRKRPRPRDAIRRRATCPCAEGNLAAALQLAQEGALGRDAGARFGVVERGDEAAMSRESVARVSIPRAP